MAAEQRRLAAILFADMVGFSALTQRDEAGALRLVQEYQGRLRALLVGSHGREVKTMGDGILAEFDSALEATECAIALQRELAERNRLAPASKLEVRVGIHLGDVIHREQDVFGDTVNIAARIEPLAEACGVAISGTVFDQVSTKIPFPCTRLEHAFLKNIETPVAVFSLDLPWHAPPAARITPFTDRVREVELLRHAVTDAAGGRGGIIAIAGESGIGKTRLAEEVIRLAERQGFRALRARGFEDVRGAPYAPWVEIAGALLRGAPSPFVYRACDQCAREVATLLPELAERLGPFPPRAATGPEEATLQLFDGVTRFLQNVAREGPLVLLLDDLQWVDRGSLSLLEYLASRLQGLRILVTLTFRDVEVDPEGPLRRSLLNLRLRGGLKEVSLARFGSGETRALVEAVLGTPALSGDLTPPVVEKTGGNPLFVEEVLRALVEDGSLFRTPEGWQRRPESRVEIPPTVREVIHRRVDRIGPEAEGVLAVAAVLGNEFDFPTLQETSGMDPEKLLPLVEAALRARLLHEREVAPGQSTLRLADEQIRDVLYSSLSLVRRGQLHRRAGEGLERLLGNRSGERGEEVGQHYLLGNRPEKAAEFFTKAGDRAREVFAHEAAVAAYGRAVTLLDAALAGGQDSPGWRAIGLRTLQGLADVEYDSGQYERCTETYLRAASLAPPSDLPARALNLRWAAGALERRNDYTAALRLLDQAEEVLGEVPADPPPGAWRVAWLEVLYARTMVYYWLDDTERREQLLTRVRPVVERGQRPAELVRLYSYLGMHAWRRDRTITDAAFEVFRKGWACEEAARVAKVDPPVVGDDAFMRGWIYFWHGDFAEARAQLAEGIASAERRHNVEGLSRALTYAMLVARRMGDVEETRRFVPSVLAAADKANLPEYGAMAVANQAWLAWRDGEFDRVESPGEEALDTWNRIPERYPVDWLALWPMMGVALSRGDVARAVDLGKRLLAPTQEPLPPHLRTLVEEAVAAQSVGDAAQASSALNRALEAAKGPGYV